MAVPCVSKVAKKKETSTCTKDNGLANSSLPTTGSLESCVYSSRTDAKWTGDDQPTTKVSGPSSPSNMRKPRSIDISPCISLCGSVSLEETMSTCNSLISPEFDYVENEDVLVKSTERNANNNLHISGHAQKEGKVCQRNILLEMGPNENADDKTSTDPQFCAHIARDIYMNARASEAKKRPSTNFMEMIQKDINASMRAVLIDWLVEVSEEYRLVPETLFLTVNYIDRYLSGNLVNRQQLQLLGVACMMIASKYEEISAPQVEEFCYVTDNTYCKDEILQMESAVLNYLNFEMTVPTAKFFLEQFVHAAQINQDQSLQFDCLANYIAELSLLEYTMLHYSPSLIAASAAFLAKFILSPSKKPWDSALGHYTLYQPSDMCDCVKALHQLCRNGGYANLPAIREKYSQHKYKFVAKKYCPASIPQEFFQDTTK
ncbi:hypothetical protein CCACVL1_30461 [Corchorus capsularis]|uniref:Uncharacterized protein n=1 Tax=Corchorus capsularis TaxID=210143 RepID=A0A1R3FX22_COCAP|nr:hypothetical protein CCACVL1_30461 [Corchorus capsularis]